MSENLRGSWYTNLSSWLYTVYKNNTYFLNRLAEATYLSYINSNAVWKYFPKSLIPYAPRFLRTRVDVFYFWGYLWPQLGSVRDCENNTFL